MVGEMFLQLFNRPVAASLAAVVSIIGSGCSKVPPAPRQITGQVFIVTRGGPSIKMALVEVFLYEAETLEQHIKSRGPDVDSARQRAEAIATAAEHEAIKADEEVERAKDAATNAAGKAWFDVFLAELKFRRAAAKEAAEIRDTAKALVRISQSGYLYFEQLPKPITSAKTDADGNFSTTTTQTKTQLALAASTSRAVGAGEEVYYWAIRLPPAEQVTKVALTNDNQSASDSSTSMLHTVALDSEATKALVVSPEELRTRLQKLNATITSTNALLSSSPSPPAPMTRTDPSPVAPLPEFSPTPPPEFVRLTNWFTLTNSKGKEVKTLEPGKRLRVVSQGGDQITVDYLGESYSIPSTVTEPSK